MLFGLTTSTLLTIVLTIGWLVILEGLLSGDNALVLAVMVRHLPKREQRRALTWGIWGAIGFRLIAVIFAYYLLRFWQLKVIGGLYLILLAVRHFLSGSHDTDSNSETSKSFGRGFWGTVVSVELADIAFSIDSILAAVALVEGWPENLRDNKILSLGIVYLGGILGIIMMRFVATLFIRILDRFKGLAAGAYILVAWIGIKLAGGGIHDAFHPIAINGQIPAVAPWIAGLPRWMHSFPWEIRNWVFWVGMIVIVAGSIALGPKHKKGPHGDHSHAERGDDV